MLAVLHLTEPRVDGLERLSELEWRKALEFADRARLTLSFRDRARDSVPPAVRERLDRNAAGNLKRLAKMEKHYGWLAARLHQDGIEFVGLKGLTHCALFGLPAENRVQYDVDLFCPRETVHRANAALVSEGYAPAEGMEKFPTDHLPVLVLAKKFEWHGDYFDPELPTAVELHFQFWNERQERLPAPRVEEFWDRRTTRQIAGVEWGVLSAPDALAYACLHALKHVLRGSVNHFHIYEIACMLSVKSEDTLFWNEWRAVHSPELRRLESVVFRLAREWFGCAIPHGEPLPEATEAWFAEFAVSPAAVTFDSNKDELWLHASLLTSRRDFWVVARRRLLPGNLPPRGAAAVTPANINWRLAYARRFAARARHHAISLPKTAASGARWWWKTNSLGEQFWIFLGAAVVFNFANFVFVLLYNLYLIDLGFREDFLGVVNGAARLGSLAGTLPAAWVAHRFGLRKAFLAAIAAIAVDTAARALFTGKASLVGLAFAGGCMFSLWAVIMAPLIASAVGESRRPAAFSVFFGTMFSTGILGNWLGGRLPLWLHGKQPVLLWSAAAIALAILPALRFRPAPMARAHTRIYPRSRFLAMFLIPFALWHLATGAFNPLNNVYFARLHFSVERIGSLFSITQLVQVVAVLAAPLILRKAGLVGGIVWMMAATAMGLLGLAAQPSAAAAALAYTAYMAFQWMSEPGLNTLLMNQVDERERSGASSLNYLVAFSAQAVAAFAAGALVSRMGYGVVLGGAAALAVAAAALFQLLLKPAPQSRSLAAPAPENARS